VILSLDMGGRTQVFVHKLSMTPHATRNILFATPAGYKIMRAVPNFSLAFP